jgi:hypothetical protein
MNSIYRISTPEDFPFASDFDYKQLQFRIEGYLASGGKTKKMKRRLMRKIATSHCFRELRILLVKLLESKDNE